MTARRKARGGVTFDQVRALALALPGVEEGTSYGTPAFRVRKKLLARLREDGETLVIKTDWDSRDNLMETDPDTFFTTAHYRDHPSVLVCLPRVHAEALAELLEAEWRRCASKRAVAAYDAGD